MDKFNWGMRACGIFLLWAATAIALPAQTFTVLHSFNGTDGWAPLAGLVQGTDGNFYGTTWLGGALAACGSGCGTVFKITPSGILTNLYDFCSQSGCTDGDGPVAGLVQGPDGNFYGTTASGGGDVCQIVGGCGTVFKITTSGTLTSFTFSEFSGGSNPEAGLVQGPDGNFYGTTVDGGANGPWGTVFKITTSGTLTTLHSFSGGDGQWPIAGLVHATDGRFYGTTQTGGGYYGGTVFSITASGILKAYNSFCRHAGCGHGETPYAGLVQGTDGNFYGTTKYGGGGASTGTVFKMTPSGTLTTLYSFCAQTNCADGRFPVAGLVQGTDGNFYGTTQSGGENNNSSCTVNGITGCGTVFSLTPSGTLTTLYNFCSQNNCTDGYSPQAALMQGTNGTFYGTAFGGGANGDGTVFSLSVGLGPFVETQPTLGKVGMPVKILGTNLTGATSVTFNGTAATFTVVSKSLITTTVPSGATTGTVQVVTPDGTLWSNVPFRVQS